MDNSGSGIGSRQVAEAAVRMAISGSREEESILKLEYQRQNIRTAAMDFGGSALTLVPKLIERAVVGAKREGLIGDSHWEEGAVAGAVHEALVQIMPRMAGLNVGGKIGVSRSGEHLCAAVFFSIGMIHLDDVAIALAHRAMENRQG